MTREEAEAICRAQFNKVGLYGGTEACRVIGFCDGKRDYYWIGKVWGGERRYYSMVGGFDHVDGDYTNLNWDRMVPPVPEFIVEVE